ncbi:PQQ-dependent sugar dehydrogenase [Intrasporangium sp.]|uniref:PQQ-dependent sugar dehydrogenase n=1 Tax=Intrasporangium sp. TaxID=1925024 RepID=UPI002B497635|nr:PQQ-dependent sugar dehydrogenase [Intrasporangium sp.]
MMAQSPDGIAGSRARAGRVAALMVGVLIAAAALAATVRPEPAVAVQRLPSGFVLQDIATGMTAPSASGPGDLLTDFAFLPDESFVAVGKYGRVQWVPRTGTPRRLASLTVNAAGDLGLVSVAAAPDYETSRAIYTARTVPSTGPGSGANGILRLSRWTVVVDQDGLPTGLSDERAVFETSSDGRWHSFGSIVVEPDGTLWTTVGDGVVEPLNKVALRSLDVNDVHGKVLHLRPDGSGVPTNPFFDQGDPRAPRSLVFASGLRSPFRFSLDPVTGLPILGDVGQSTTEEVNLIRPGYSYGWPCWEGSAPTKGYSELAECQGVTTTKPVWEYPHAGSGSAVTGGVVYTGTSYPAAYRGRYFFADYVDGMLWTMAFSPAGVLTTTPEQGGFGSEIGSPVRFDTVRGGDIVFADIGAARLRRLVYAPGNAAPTAAYTSVTDTPGTMTFDGTSSTDPNGDTLTYRWDFGDGATASGPTTTHRFPADPDHHDVTLTVTDPLGATSSTTQTVYPTNLAPNLDVTWPDPSVTYAVGETVHAEATASDPEDGALTVSWSSRLEHCYAVTDCHQHHGTTGQGALFDLPMEGHEGDTQLWVAAAATDSKGATTRSEFAVRPRQRRVTITSTWPAAFTMADVSAASAVFTEGMTITVVAADKGHDGLSGFTRWGDGEVNRDREVVVGSRDITLEAIYQTPIDRRYAGDAAFRTALGDPAGVEQGDLSTRSRTFSKGSAHWSPAAGVHYVAGAIAQRFTALGGLSWCGVPVTDDLPTTNGDGRYNDFASSCSIYWSAASGAHAVSGAVRNRWIGLGAEQSLLGYPTRDLALTASRTGYIAVFQKGVIYHSGTTGTRYLTSPILPKYRSIGAETSQLRYPTTDTRATASGAGRYQHFQDGSIFWSSDSSAHVVTGTIRSLWASLGWERSWLGYPTIDVTLTASRNGYVARFQGGAVYASGPTGAHYVRDAILSRYTAMKAEASYLRYPTTNTNATASGVGRYQHFQGGSMFWSSGTGAHPVTGAIRTAWAKLGWERSWLGYPKSDPYTVTVGIRQNFQHGYLVWNRSTGAVRAYSS